MSRQFRQSRPLDQQERFLRRAELKANLGKGHPSPWIFRAAGWGQLLTVPFIVGYFMFYVDNGDKENVFSEPRRWLQKQKDAFLNKDNVYKDSHTPPSSAPTPPASP